MRARIQFKKSVLSISLSALSSRSLFCGMLMLPYSAHAVDTLSNVSTQLKSEKLPLDVPIIEQPRAEQMQQGSLSFDDLEALPIEPIDQSLVNQIYQVAERAKQEANDYRAGQHQDLTVRDATQQEISEINLPPVNVDSLIQSIQADREIVVQANATGAYIGDVNGRAPLQEQRQQPGLFKRLLYKVRPPREMAATTVPRISADVKFTAQARPQGLNSKAYTQALEGLEKNIEAKLSSFTQESFADFASALPQLRLLANQAAQAVGFYHADFRFERINESKVLVNVTPNAPVLVTNQNIEFSGAGANQSQFRVLTVLPDLEEGDIFHHGKYENTKERIATAASNNGYFDAYWRLHDVKVSQPQDTADINLRYETGTRYKILQPTFRMSDESREFPLDMDVLESMVPWKTDADYAFWRVNLLSNNLANSRYFNYALVEAIIPDPIEKQLELPPDL